MVAALLVALESVPLKSTVAVAVAMPGTTAQVGMVTVPVAPIARPCELQVTVVDDVEQLRARLEVAGRDVRARDRR